jgi:hypothetical protein
LSPGSFDCSCAWPARTCVLLKPQLVLIGAWRSVWRNFRVCECRDARYHPSTSLGCTQHATPSALCLSPPNAYLPATPAAEDDCETGGRRCEAPPPLQPAARGPRVPWRRDPDLRARISARGPDSDRYAVLQSPGVQLAGRHRGAVPDLASTSRCSARTGHVP